MKILRVLFFAIASQVCLAGGNVFQIKLIDAETQSLRTSHRVKSFEADEESAKDQANVQFTNLLPKLSFQANYQYYGAIPTLSLGAGPPIPFGTNSTYAIGPNLSYTLWDTFSGRQSYQASTLLAEARTQDKINAELQLLYTLRTAYIQVQLGLEELRAINDSLELARAQDRDVGTRYRAGAAAQLDVVTSGRSVLGYEIQFKQRQAELSSALTDLLSLLGEYRSLDISRPGPQGVTDSSLTVKLDEISESLAQQSTAVALPLDNDHPQLHSLDLQAQSSEMSAESQTAKMFPTLQLNAGITSLLPNIPNPYQYWQETIGITLSLPLLIGDPSPDQASQLKNAAMATRHRKAQLLDDLQRDFLRTRTLLMSLQERRKLAAQDVIQSGVASKLYYRSYLAGKVNLIDVQNANVQALQAKVNAARIDAQTLNQLVLLKFLSGKESHHGRS